MIPIDKQLHFFATAMLTAWLFILFGSISLAIVIALIIGAAKELVWDLYLSKGTPDIKDMYANIAGAFATVLVVIIKGVM